MAVATRLPLSLAQAGGWADTALTLPAGTFEDVLTGKNWSGKVRLAEMLSIYPAALLQRRGPQDTAAGNTA